MTSLLRKSISNFQATLRGNGKFKYNLLDNDISHFKKHMTNVLKTIKEAEKLISSNKSDEIASFEHYFKPDDTNIGLILNGIDKASHKSIPVPGGSKQEKSDYIIEKYFYNKLKPLKLLDNIQKYNHVKPSSNTTFKIMDINNPVEWFPLARKLKRKIIMHVGPTNSGKTYNALKRLEDCKSGYYAGPLRLLAREVYDKFQLKNIRCNLLTGEEVEPDIDQYGNISGLTSGTVEMISLNEEFEVVVLDEIQMISDPHRGWAWTNVVLGCQLKELHLCGEVSAVPLIKQIAKLTGDDLVVNEYKRLGALKVNDFPITQLSEFRKGDCIVAFSKKKILDIKLFMEHQTDLKCGVVYGALPPETRVSEANKFNSGEYDVLILSDAVGMGLNLKINRIIFTTLNKFDGSSMKDLSRSLIKQIGGRAGRYGMGSSGAGIITSIDATQVAKIDKAMRLPIDYLPQMGLFMPDSLLVRYFSMFPPNTTWLSVFKRFESDLKELKLKQEKDPKREASLFFISESIEEQHNIAEFFVDFGLLNGFSITDQLRTFKLPLNLRYLKRSRLDKNDKSSDMVTRDMINVLRTRSSKSVVNFPQLLQFYNTTNTARSDSSDFDNDLKNSYAVQLGNLSKLEILHQQINTYLWLSYRFPKNYIDYESVRELKNLTETKISDELDELRYDKLRRNEFMFD